MADRARCRLTIKGMVQGVGFRPFVYRLAHAMDIAGWISNSAAGVVIEAEGSASKLKQFILRLESDKPAIARISALESLALPPQFDKAFRILPSGTGENPSVMILPDLATCAACLKDIDDPENRRFRYPFTNCTDCGPRFSIIEKLPYDRQHTTMRGFEMCRACRKEYEDPADRRFHAQPNACPACGPHLELWDEEGTLIETHDAALLAACENLRAGAILACKGIGGFHLLVDAANDASVEALRRRKNRPDKPFALMYPSLALAAKDCWISEVERALLLAPQAPIVLLKARDRCYEAVAKGNPYLGVMLPYTPLHHLLLNDFGMPLVATSGNRSDEPICVDEREAVQRLKGIAEGFLVHNRPILRPLDDSIVKEIGGSGTMLRRARGYSSEPLTVAATLPPALAVGGQLKSASAIGFGHTVVLSQHLGDLDNAEAYGNYLMETNSLLHLYALKPEVVVADCHPDYTSTRFAFATGKRLRHCQHHLAHVYACMGERGTEPPLLGVAWDGAGYGTEGAIWGGEFFSISKDLSAVRCGSLRSFPLPCGERGIKEPRLAALGVLYRIFGDEAFTLKELAPLHTISQNEAHNLHTLFRSGFRTSPCTSMGRLFDAIASLLGICHITTFEGQAAMALEFLSEKSSTTAAYPYTMAEDAENFFTLNWEPMVRDIIADFAAGRPPAEIAKMVHNTLAAMIVSAAQRTGRQRVALSGGVFQNKVLTESAIARLQAAGFNPICHRNVPPNDGSIALGQLISLQASNNGGKPCV